MAVDDTFNMKMQTRDILFPVPRAIQREFQVKMICTN